MSLNPKAPIFVPSFQNKITFNDSRLPKRDKAKRKQKKSRRNTAKQEAEASTENFPAILSRSKTPTTTITIWNKYTTKYIKEKLQDSSPSSSSVDEAKEIKDDALSGLIFLKREGTRTKNHTRNIPDFEESPAEATPKVQSSDQLFTYRGNLSRLRDRWWETLSRQPPPSQPLPLTREELPVDPYYSVIDPVIISNTAFYPVIRPTMTGIDSEDNYEARLWRAVEDDDLHQVQEILSLHYSARVVKRPSNGDTILHVACARPPNWVQIIVSSVGKNHRLFFEHNHRNETPFHVACRNKTSENLELLLARGNPASIQKGLATHDCQGNTPLHVAIHAESLENVTTLLMWHGNSNFSVIKLSQKCPLVEAVSAERSIELIDLLLEFSSPREYTYDMWQALYTCVTSTRSQNFLRHLDRLLDSGANPCTTVNPCKTSLMTIACQQKVPHGVITHLITRYRIFLSRLQGTRRRDPMLQRQPLSFFEGLESRENTEISASLRDALVTSLFMGWKENSCESFNNAILLFDLGAELNEFGMERLEMSLRADRLLPAQLVEKHKSSRSSWRYVTTYKYLPIALVEKDEPRIALKNRMLKQGMRSFSCPVIRQLKTPETYSTFDTVLRTLDDKYIECHRDVIAAKSDKLAAAFDFARRQGEVDSVIIELNCTFDAANLMLQHMYHGSFITTGPSQSCDLLLNLLMLSQEILCPTLGVECTLRILNRNVGAQCFCGRCNRHTEHLDGWVVHVPSLFEGASPPLSPTFILDVIAVSEEVEQSHLLSDLKITVKTPNKDHDVEVMKLLRAECSRCLLWNFDSVAKMRNLEMRVDFDGVKGNEDADTMLARSALIEYCVHEIVQMPWISANLSDSKLKLEQAPACSMKI